MNRVIYGETTGNKLRLINPRFVSNKYYTQDSNVLPLLVMKRYGILKSVSVSVSVLSIFILRSEI